MDILKAASVFSFHLLEKMPLIKISRSVALASFAHLLFVFVSVIILVMNGACKS